MPNAKPITWSFSGLKDFVGCPKRYYHTKVTKEFVQGPTEATIYGESVHKACELYITEDKPFPPAFQRFEPVIAALKQAKGDKLAEHKMGLCKEKRATGFLAKNVWARGIADLVIINGDKAFVIDYKTGSDKYADTAQLKLMALMIFAHFPEVQSVKASLIFLVKNNIIKESYKREDSDRLWSHFHEDLYRLEQAFLHDVWNANPTPLCGWCPVKTCEHNRKR